MEIIKRYRIIIIIISLLVFVSCGTLGLYNEGNLLNRGKINEYGQYVPKKPKYKLKDKKDNIFEKNLDTINIYRFIVRLYRKEEPLYNTNYFHFMKFYPSGRLLSTSIPMKDNIVKLENNLTEGDLDPQNKYVRKGYYYSKDGKKVTIETFLQGYDSWNILGKCYFEDFFLNPSGDTLTIVGKEFKEIYIKEEIPIEWKKYPVDW